MKVALATDAWGVVRAHAMSNGFLVDDQAHDRAANSCLYVGKHCGEEKLLLGACAQAQEGKDGAQPTIRTFMIILIFPVKCTT